MQLLDVPDQLGIIDLAPGMQIFSDTAAIIANLDLLISVDSAAAHLAGAMGQPVWILIPFDPDWRWLVNRGDSPWYPSMRLFRQPNRGDWASVFASAEEELKKIIAVGKIQLWMNRACIRKHR